MTCKTIYGVLDVATLRRLHYTQTLQAICMSPEPWLEGDIEVAPCDVPSADEGEHVRFDLRRLFYSGFIRRVQCQCSAWRPRALRRRPPLDALDEDADGSKWMNAG